MVMLNHQVDGAGPAVVLLHAGVADLRMWDAQASVLSRSCLVVRPDLRGFGGSPLAPGASYSDAEDVLELLASLGVSTFALVGASSGGHVALQLASAAPDSVESLILVSPAAELVEPDDSLRSVWREEERLLDLDDIDAATDLNVRTWLGPEAGDGARELLRVMQRTALELQVAAGQVDARELDVRLATLTMPTRILVGLRDFAFFVDTARELAARLPQSELLELAWAGHLPSLERPEETTEHLVDFLPGSPGGHG